MAQGNVDLRKTVVEVHASLARIEEKVDTTTRTVEQNHGPRLQKLEARSAYIAGAAAVGGLGLGLAAGGVFGFF